MTEQNFDQHAVAAGAPAQPGQTGHAGVDAVIDSLAGLADRPVDEHVAVFEAAHDQLRAALDAPAGPKPPTLPGAQG